MFSIISIISLGLSMLALRFTYQRRDAIISSELLLPSPELNAVLLFNLSSALLIWSVAMCKLPSMVLLIGPLLILVGYIVVIYMLNLIRPAWRKPTLCIMCAGAPILGRFLILLMFFADRRKQ